MLKRKLVLFSLLLGLLLGGGVWDTSAFAENSSSAKINLLEETNVLDESGNPVPFKDIEGAMPGQSFSKIPKVENLPDSVSSEIRVHVEISAVDQFGNPIDFDPSDLDIDFNLEDWELRSDGYYYYKKPLAPGETTTPLFTHVAFSSALGNRYQGAVFSVKLFAEATEIPPENVPSKAPDTGRSNKSLDSAIELSLLAILSATTLFVLARLIYHRRKS